MPKLLAKIEKDFSETGHHGGGIMLRGGFDIAVQEFTPQQYAHKLVSSASLDVAYRRWKKNETVMLDSSYYLATDENKVIVLYGIGIKANVLVSNNPFWRQEARKFIETTCEDEKIDGISIKDMVDAQTCNRFGEGL